MSSKIYITILVYGYSLSIIIHYWTMKVSFIIITIIFFCFYRLVHMYLWILKYINFYYFIHLEIGFWYICMYVSHSYIIQWSWLVLLIGLSVTVQPQDIFVWFLLSFFSLTLQFRWCSLKKSAERKEEV